MLAVCLREDWGTLKKKGVLLQAKSEEFPLGGRDGETKGYWGSRYYVYIYIYMKCIYQADGNYQLCGGVATT